MTLMIFTINTREADKCVEYIDFILKNKYNISSVDIKYKKQDFGKFKFEVKHNYEFSNYALTKFFISMQYDDVLKHHYDIEKKYYNQNKLNVEL